MKPWEVLQRTTILDRGKFLRVEDHHVRLPDGRTIPDWPWIITPDFVNIVAVTPDEQFVCFRQIKYSVGAMSLAPVGGYLEPGEDALLAGQRELLEETGYVAPHWENMGSYSVDGNRGAGTAHFYLARGAVPQQAPDADDLEEQELVLLSRAEVADAVRTGAFRVLPWAACMGLALLRLDAPAAPADNEQTHA